jgi:menaquinone-9 beta-reductase
MTSDPQTNTDQAQVLVIGAGPAGSACATALARAGVDVLLIDQHAFPRDKVCGDGLIPDAMQALARLGVLEQVLERAQAVGHVRCVGPRGGHVDVPGRMAVLPRRELDFILLQNAQAAGARTLMPARFEGPWVEDGQVVGADLQVQGQALRVRARWLVLATGASPKPLLASQVCTRHTPSGVALRGYVRHPGLVGRITGLEVFWHPRLAGGYGWVFPAPGGVFNIGTGIVGSHGVAADGSQRKRGRMRDMNLRRMLEDFTTLYPPAAELVRGGQWLGDVKGAPLRCSLGGAQWSRPGMLVTGEAAGSTYAFTGEGIGKAMECGLLAAEAIVQGQLQSQSDADTRSRYEAGLAALMPRFSLYERAAVVNNWPFLVDWIVWRGRTSATVRERMAGLLEETTQPGRLFTWRRLRLLLTG